MTLSDWISLRMTRARGAFRGPAPQPDARPQRSSGRCWGRLALAALTLGVQCWLLVPLRPSFPESADVDASWRLAMNESWARQLVHGVDIAFTFGPYAAVYTQEYHPASAAAMFCGGLLMAAAYGAALLRLALGRNHAGLLAVLLVMLGGVWGEEGRDALFLCYPLLVALAMAQPRAARSARTHAGALLLDAALCVPLGFLPLVKGSLLAPCASVSLLCAAICVRQRRPLLALLSATVPPLAGALFWRLAGQPLAALPQFLWATLEMIRGYSDAMGLRGPPEPLLTYAAGALALLWSVASGARTDAALRALLAGATALCLFAAFKAGFVRQDTHMLAGAQVLLLAALFLPLARLSASGAGPLLAALCWALLVAAPPLGSPLLAQDRLQRALRSRTTAFGGAAQWLAADRPLERRFAAALRSLARQCALPRLAGTSDTYSYGQACLIAAGNHWQPRPVFQSYVAYTPALAALNRSHLLGKRAAQQLLFRVQPIDGRLPALDDGASWPALLEAYELESLDGELALLRRRPHVAVPPAPELVHSGRHALGEWVALPEHDGPLIAELELEPSWFGRILTLALRSTPARLELQLESGTRSFRFVAALGRARFLLSPLVESTRDFALLAAANPDFLELRRVRGLRITSSAAGSWLWSSPYSLRLSRVALRRHAALLKGPDWSQRAEPRGIASERVGACDAAIETANGAPIDAAPLGPARGLALVGWAAASAVQGERADELFVLLAPARGTPLLFHTRAGPADLGADPEHATSMQPGFAALLDASALRGEYTLRIAQRRGSELRLCEQSWTLRLAR